MSPFQIPVTIFCTILWLKNRLQSATAAISSPLSPVKEFVGSSSSSSRSVNNEKVPICEIERKRSSFLGASRIGAGGS